MNAYDIAKLLGCSYPMALKIMSAPDFPAIKAGRRLYCTEKGFEKWLEQNQGRTVWKKPGKEKKQKRKYTIVKQEEFNPVWRGP